MSSTPHPPNDGPGPPARRVRGKRRGASGGESALSPLKLRPSDFRALRREHVRRGDSSHGRVPLAHAPDSAESNASLPPAAALTDDKAPARRACQPRWRTSPRRERRATRGRATTLSVRSNADRPPRRPAPLPMAGPGTVSRSGLRTKARVRCGCSCLSSRLAPPRHVRASAAAMPHPTRQVSPSPSPRAVATPRSRRGSPLRRRYLSGSRVRAFGTPFSAFRLRTSQARPTPPGPSARPSTRPGSGQSGNLTRPGTAQLEAIRGSSPRTREPTFAAPPGGLTTSTAPRAAPQASRPYVFEPPRRPDSHRLSRRRPGRFCPLPDPFAVAQTLSRCKEWGRDRALPESAPL